VGKFAFTKGEKLRKSTISIIKYVRDILLVLITVVILARSGNMPVIVPEKFNDFIIDTTEAFLSGDFFHSFRGFMSDTADYVNKGEKAVDIKEELINYHSLLSNYFLRTKKNLLFLASRNKIRGALPDFNKSLTALFAQNLLDRIIYDYHDVDQISLIRANKSVVLSARRLKTLKFDEKKLDITEIGGLAKVQGVKTFILGDNRFCLVTHVFSRMREKEGYLVLVLNHRQIEKVFSQRQQYKSGYFPFIYNKKNMLFVEGRKSKALLLLKKKLVDARISIEILKNKTYIDLGEISYRVLLKPLFTGHSIQLGIIGVEGSIIPFLLLISRSILLIFAIWLLIYLVRLIYRTILEMVKHEKLANDFNKLLLKKSIDTNRKVLNAAEISFKKTVEFMDNINRSNKELIGLAQQKSQAKIKITKSVLNSDDSKFLEIPFSEDKILGIKNKSDSLLSNTSLHSDNEIMEGESCPGYPDFKDDYVPLKPIFDSPDELIN